MKVIIPARGGSKGLPGKNKTLLPCTLSIIPSQYEVHVSTDDLSIAEVCNFWGVRIHSRSADTATDKASVLGCLKEWMGSINASPDELVLMLYLTYPQRTWREIQEGLRFMEECEASSLLCRYEPTDHPYLCFKKQGDQGVPVVDHTLYRRQDYPRCFVVSHYITAFKAGELDNLGLNLYNKDTVFFPISKPIDVDTKQDLQSYREAHERS